MRDVKTIAKIWVHVTMIFLASQGLRSIVAIRTATLASLRSAVGVEAQRCLIVDRRSVLVMMTLEARPRPLSPSAGEASRGDTRPRIDMLRTKIGLDTKMVFRFEQTK